MKSGVSINSSNVLVAFNVPSILVPDTFTFTTAITHPSSTVGFVPANGTTTGTWDQTWFGSPGTFGALTNPAFQVEGRVIATDTQAVPLPSSLAGGSAVLLLLAGMTRLRADPARGSEATRKHPAGTNQNVTFELPYPNFIIRSQRFLILAAR